MTKWFQQLSGGVMENTRETRLETAEGLGEIPVWVFPFDKHPVFECYNFGYYRLMCSTASAVLSAIKISMVPVAVTNKTDVRKLLAESLQILFHHTAIREV